MKKFNLNVFMFAAYTLFNDEHIEKEDGTKIVADAKGFVTLVSSEDAVIGGKNYKKGSNVKMKMSDIMTWPEESDWVEVEVPKSETTNQPSEKPVVSEEDKAKATALKEAKAEHKALIAKVRDSSEKLVEAVMKGGIDTAPFTSIVQTAKTNLANFEATHPEVLEKAKVGRVAVEPKQEREYTEEERTTITAYEEANKAYEATLEILKKQKESLRIAREALPNDYKVKGNAGTGVGGGPKPPKLTPEIMANIYKCFNGEAYTVNGVEKPAKEGGETNAETARIFGYSGPYTNLVIKGKGVELFKYEKKIKAATTTAPETNAKA